MKKYLIIAIFPFFIQCLEPDCNNEREEYMTNECIVILEDDYAHSYNKDVYLKPKGINPETGKYCKCADTGRDWGRYQEYMEKGDTFMKRKGDTFFTLHKKDTILRVDWGTCDENNEFIIPENNPPQIDNFEYFKKIEHPILNGKKDEK